MDNVAVLVTGANGFIGRALCEALVKAGYSTRGSVRKKSFASEEESCHPSVEWLETGEIGPDTDWSSALQGVKSVVHLAGRAHKLRNEVWGALELYRKVNVEGTRRLMGACVTAGVRRLIFMSSVKAMHEGALEITGHYTEADECKPDDPYGVSKKEAEDVVFSPAYAGKIEVVVLRPPLVYGPWVKGNFMRLLKLTDRGVPLPLASVRNYRSMVFVGNLADAVIKCIQHPSAAGNIFLVSDGEDISTAELIRHLAKALQRPARLFLFPLALFYFAGKMMGRSADVDRLLGTLAVDSSKIRRVLDWKPPFSMTEGIEKTVRWYRDEIKKKK